MVRLDKQKSTQSEPNAILVREKNTASLPNTSVNLDCLAKTEQNPANMAACNYHSEKLHKGSAEKSLAFKRGARGA